MQVKGVHIERGTSSAQMKTVLSSAQITNSEAHHQMRMCGTAEANRQHRRGHHQKQLRVCCTNEGVNLAFFILMFADDFSDLY